MKCKEGYADKEKYRRYRNSQKKRRNDKSMLSAKRSRERWRHEDILLVLKHEISDKELAATLGRSLQSIMACRHKYKNRLEYTR